MEAKFSFNSSKKKTVSNTTHKEAIKCFNCVVETAVTLFNLTEKEKEIMLQRLIKAKLREGTSPVMLAYIKKLICYVLYTHYGFSCTIIALCLNCSRSGVHYNIQDIEALKKEGMFKTRNVYKDIQNIIELSSYTNQTEQENTHAGP